MAGRICLIKSVITVVPLFYLSLFKAPDSICKSIISIQRRFLWGWGKESRPISWVSWQDLCKSKDDGNQVEDAQAHEAQAQQGAQARRITRSMARALRQEYQKMTLLISIV